MIVLDMEVLAELLRPEPDAAVLDWMASQRRGELYTTTVGEAEIATALSGLQKGRRRDALTQAVARLLGEGLGGRVLPFDRAAAAAYGELAAKRHVAWSRRRWGKSRPLPRRGEPGSSPPATLPALRRRVSSASTPGRPDGTGP